jgi:quinoprotein relay system zinc metallohydrolase 2
MSDPAAIPQLQPPVSTTDAPQAVNMSNRSDARGELPPGSMTRRAAMRAGVGVIWGALAARRSRAAPPVGIEPPTDIEPRAVVVARTGFDAPGGLEAFSGGGTRTGAGERVGVEAGSGPGESVGSSVQGALVTHEIAPGIHIRRGLDEDLSVANGNAIANIGFIVGARAVAVIDPGGSLSDGLRLRARIRAVTPLPIRYVVMSHVHPDHIFGAGAFERDRPTFVGHVRLPEALAARADYYRRGLESILGRGAAGPLVVPTRLVVDRDKLDLGGRTLMLTAHGVAHSDCDLSVFDPSSATLLPADLLFVERVPALDGRVTGWQRELAALKAVAARRAVPGHGPVSVDWPAGANDLDRYLEVLLRETRAAVKDGMDIGAAVAVVGQSERARWKLFDDYQGHNITLAFKELEWESTTPL